MVIVSGRLTSSTRPTLVLVPPSFSKAKTVTSPGGTSAAALYYLEKAGFRTAISRAVWAAYERSRELGVDSSAHWPETLPQSPD